MVKLVNIDNLKVSKTINLKELLPIIADILSKGRVKESIAVDSNYNVKYNLDIYLALKTIGVTRVPISIDLPENIDYTLEELGFYDTINVNPLRVYNSTLELLYRGWPTPLVKLNTLSSGEVQVWAKLEGFNPFSHSVKDRTAWAMIMKALKDGKLKDILYEATSTNTGMALTSIANILGRKVKLFIPKTIQKVSDIYLRILGAEVVRVPTSLTVEALELVEESAKRDNAVHLNQFENDANFEVHLKYTAKEIELQLKNLGINPTCIIGGLGTSGHLSAIAFYFKNRYKGKVKVVGVQPAPGETISGIRRVETGMKWIHWVEIDEIVDVKLSEAVKEAINIARSEGILIGLSAGATVHALKKLNPSKGVYILIFPDLGYKYFEQFVKYMQHST